MKKRILIAGLGGVGGYLGGMLARHYADSDVVEVIFYARGAHAAAIQQDGLQVHGTKGNFTAFPRLVTHVPSEIGRVDYVLLCTKTYDLEECIARIRPCVRPETVLLPLANGVDSPAMICKVFPFSRIWEGCIYLVAQRISPGIIEETGGIQSLFFGSGNEDDGGLIEFEKLLRAAGVMANFSPAIQVKMWEKFLFISSIATATSYFDCSIGKVLETNEMKNCLVHLQSEVVALAREKEIPLPHDSLATTLAKMQGLPYTATSSMHRDFQAGNRTELESLTGYVVAESSKYGLDAPHYTRLYGALAARF